MSVYQILVEFNAPNNEIAEVFTAEVVGHAREAAEVAHGHVRVGATSLAVGAREWSVLAEPVRSREQIDGRS